MSQLNNHIIFNKLPFEIVDLDEETRRNVFTMLSGGKCVFVGPKKYLFHYAYTLRALKIYNFEARPDDVYHIGFPRSGTTLHSELIWQISNDLDFEKVSKDLLLNRFPHIDDLIYMNIEEVEENTSKKQELSKRQIAKVRKGCSSIDNFNKMQERRFIKSHLPISLMPPHMFEVGAKIIYCARNPKDVVVSLYHGYYLFNSDTLKGATFKTFVYAFMNDRVTLAPFLEHVKEGWARRNDPNFLFLFYEDYIKDAKQTIRKMSHFLGKHLTEDQISRLEDYLSFQNFKKNKSVNWDHLQICRDPEYDFIRKGKAGGWREYFDEELSKEFDDWLHTNLEGSDLKFPAC